MAAIQKIMTINYNEPESLAISDLTNTKWVFNNSLSLIFGRYNINYESNGSTFDILNVTSTYLSYDLAGETSQQAYFKSAWTNQAYRIIEITGGTDATNSTLIQWLSNNATQVTIDDLTGTKWLFNDTVNIEGHEGNWDIIFNHGDGMYVGKGLPDVYVIDYNSNINDYNAYYDNAWVDETYKTIEITGGTDVTNADLIAWLSSNATQVIEPEPPTPTGDNKIFFGSLPISKILLGNTEVTAMYFGSLQIYGGGDTPEPTVISFTINFPNAPETCQAEQGMTWYEWCQSDYNTFGLSCEDNNTHPHSVSGEIPSVVGSDTIIEGWNYIINTGGSND